ncbi:low temperature requirement protein A [Micromonospora soli]|uniref:low temperature requirement protein A n=1 Tax=Micromonospora sp. NBRC 110009 TaxID=3061627 RepID=UPI0026729DF2|nr:low temperature requirement protein A [Micromonospora sp. NBRC 110009]WKT98185.1 low temperature requirement protein A [Micromonospora sp. NBRC 110009]
MSDGAGGRRRRGLRFPVSPTGEGQTVTRFELLFDLVYVFAITRVSEYMAHAHSAPGLVQGLLLLALLWWTWSGYSWLGNQARADQGLLRAAMSVAMAAIFVVDLTIPEAWHDAPGGLYGPLVLVCAYLIVRCVHLVVYSVAAAGDPGLRHQLAITWVPTAAGAALLLVGVLLGGWRQTLFFAAALAVDWGVVYLTSRRGNWRIHSATHWTERHGLFVILAIGESILALGVGATNQPVSTPILVAAVLGIAVAIGLWWLYFDLVSPAYEHRFREAQGQARTILAAEAYTYGHFPIVAGIVLAALGVEGVLAHAGEHRPLGVFYAAALCGGTALYLAGHLAFANRMHYALHVGRFVTMLALLAWLPAAAVLPPLVGLTGLALILAALIVVETIRYADIRPSLRGE